MPKLQDFKALLFDVDRTLTNTKYLLPEDVITNLKQLAESNFEIGICTGRGFPTVSNYILPHFPKDSLHVLNGGGEISSARGKIIDQEGIPADLVAPIIDFVTTKNKRSFLSTHSYLYATDKYLENYQKHPWKFSVKPMSQYQSDLVTLICVIDISEENIDTIPGWQKLNVKFMTSNDGKPYADITKKGITKAAALKIWSKKTGIPLSQVVGFGDSLNDLEFLQATSFGVAMKNADDQIKKIANRVIGHVDENGLSNYLTEIISGKEL